MKTTVQMVEAVKIMVTGAEMQERGRKAEREASRLLLDGLKILAGDKSPKQAAEEFLTAWHATRGDGALNNKEKQISACVQNFGALAADDVRYFTSFSQLRNTAKRLEKVHERQTEKMRTPEQILAEMNGEITLEEVAETMAAPTFLEEVLAFAAESPEFRAELEEGLAKLERVAKIA